MIVADTDVLIDFLKDAKPMSDRIEFEIQHGLATTCVTGFELWAGCVGSSKRELVVENLLSALRILPLDAQGAKTAAQTRDLLKSKGRSLGMADALIAGICIQQNAMLLTRNTKHFEDIPGLVLAARV